MTEKQFRLRYDEKSDYDNIIETSDKVYTMKEVVDKLNNLLEENEQLKHSFNKLKHRHSLLHDVCIETECDRDSFKKDVISLEKENEKLRQELESFEQINFTDLCDGTRTILYMKKEKYINKENIGDENE